MHGGRNADAFKRLLAAETLFEQIKHRHFFGGPLHTKATFFGQLNIGNVVGQFFGSHSFSPEQIIRFTILDLRFTKLLAVTRSAMIYAVRFTPSPSRNGQ